MNEALRRRDPPDDTRIREIVEMIIGLAPLAVIVHHVPGRIRLKLTASPEEVSTVTNEDLRDTLRSVPGIRGARINPIAKSMVVSYDPEVLPRDLWALVEQLTDNPELGDMVRARFRALFTRS